jgi:hypothetical protein
LAFGLLRAKRQIMNARSFEDQAATIRATIERRIPETGSDVNPISILFGDRIGLTSTAVRMKGKR